MKKKICLLLLMLVCVRAHAQDILTTETNTIVTHGDQGPDPNGYTDAFFDVTGNGYYSYDPMAWFWAGAGMVFSFWMFGWCVRIARTVSGSGHSSDPIS